MEILATVSSISGGKYRVNTGGCISAPIPGLASAYRLEIDADGTAHKIPPAMGDTVLCWFPGNALRDGCVVGIWEG